MKPSLTAEKSLAVFALAWGLAMMALAWGAGIRSGMNVFPLGLALTILLLGNAYGPLAAWGSALVSGLFCLALYLRHGMDLDSAWISLAAFLACATYPVPWSIRKGRAEAAFQSTLQPLKDARDLVQAQLEKSRMEVEEAKRRSKESDALYHVSREISKVLTLSETLEFSKEVLAEALKRKPQGGKKQEDSAMFLLLLVDEEARKVSVGCSGGVTDDMLRAFTDRVSEKGVLNWILHQRQAFHVPDLARDPRFPGETVPGFLKSAISVPLLIKGQLIGLILVFDTAEGAFDRNSFENFMVLGSQIAIGLEKAMLYDMIQRLSVTDGLTGLYVHRYLQERLEEEVRRAVRYSAPLGFLMMDIDFFKKYNDTFGHLAGDEVLKRVARILAAHAEGSDIVARYGGEEFALILPNQAKELALKKAEAIRRAVESEPFTFEGQAARVTISCGVAAFPQDAMTKKGLIDRADQALYQAKAKGRNVVVTA